MKKFLLISFLGLISFGLKAQTYNFSNLFMTEVRLETTKINGKYFGKSTFTAAYFIKNKVGVGLDGGGYRSILFKDYQGDCNFHGGFVGLYISPIVFDKSFFRIMIPIRSQIGSFKYSLQDCHYYKKDKNLQWQYHIDHHYYAQVTAGIDLDFFTSEEFSFGLSASYPLVHNKFELRNKDNNNNLVFNSNQLSKINVGLTLKINLYDL